MDIRVIPPTEAFQQCYNAYITELGDEERYPMPMDLNHDDFPALIERLNGYSDGIGLPDGLVPNSTFWLICNDTLAGVANLRHYLTPALQHAGGHIGLGIRPGYRGRGLGTLLLAYTVEKARSMNIRPVHIHCHQHNLASVGMITACGGKLHSEEDWQKQKISRYIINN